MHKESTLYVSISVLQSAINIMSIVQMLSADWDETIPHVSQVDSSCVPEMEEELAPDLALDGCSVAASVSVSNIYNDLGVGMSATSANGGCSIPCSSNIHTELGISMSATYLRPVECELLW